MLDLLGEMHVVADGLDGVKLRHLPVGLNNGQAKRRDPTDRVSSLADLAGALPEPLFDALGPCEQVADGHKGELGEVDAGTVALVFTHEVLVD